MTESAIEKLRELLEPEVWSAHPQIEIEGRLMTAMLSPRDPESLCRVLAQLHERQLPVLVRGGGTRMGLGNLSDQTTLVLSTRQLSGVRCYEPDDGVVEVSAGTPLDEVRKRVLAQGWELPIDAGGQHSTIGGAIATAAYGPRCLGFGPVRKNVLGLEVVQASGTLTRCGGRVVKNVTGYDLAKLYTGSFGTLGVIAGAWLRLKPRPRAIEVRVAEFSQTEQALVAGLEVSRRDSARACVLLSPELARRVGLAHSLAASWILLVEFAGEGSECRNDSQWLERELGGSRPEVFQGEGALAWVDAVREAVIAEPRDQGIRVRIATLPGKLGLCIPPLIKTGARMLLDPGLGLAWAELAVAQPSQALLASDDETECSEKTACLDAAAANDFIRIARTAAAACSGSLMIEALPSELKRELDVFGEVRDRELALMKRLKHEFDPNGLLNPHRFVGGI